MLRLLWEGRLLPAVYVGGGLLPWEVKRGVHTCVRGQKQIDKHIVSHSIAEELTPLVTSPTVSYNTSQNAENPTLLRLDLFILVVGGSSVTFDIRQHPPRGHHHKHPSDSRDNRT